MLRQILENTNTDIGQGSWDPLRMFRHFCTDLNHMGWELQSKKKLNLAAYTNTVINNSTLIIFYYFGSPLYLARCLVSRPHYVAPVNRSCHMSPKSIHRKGLGKSRTETRQPGTFWCVFTSVEWSQVIMITICPVVMLDFDIPTHPYLMSRSRPRELHTVNSLNSMLWFWINSWRPRSQVYMSFYNEFKYSGVFSTKITSHSSEFERACIAAFNILATA